MDQKKTVRPFSMKDKIGYTPVSYTHLDVFKRQPLWELPRCQKQLSAACRAAGVPFMVVTQMLDSCLLYTSRCV